MLKILVAGSPPRFQTDTDDEKVDENFINICEEIGRQLAARKHQIFLLSDNKRHADIYVFHGYAAEITEKNISGPHPKISYGFEDDPENEDYDKFQEVQNRYKTIKTETLYTDDKYPFNRIAIIEEIDALIVIGGSSNTAHLVEISKALKKTIIPVIAFGGTAQSVWNRLNVLLRPALKDAIGPIVNDAKDASSKRIIGLIDIVEKVVRLQQKEAGISYITLVLVEFLVLISWFIILITGKEYPLLALPVLIFTMAFFGIILRTLIRMHKDADQIIPLKVFFIELGIGIGLGVIYYIFFLLGASAISSNFEEAVKDKTFSSIALVVSLLSVAVSFLLKESIGNVSKRFSEIAEIKT